MATNKNTPPAEPPSSQEQAAIRMIPFIVGCALFMQMLDSTVVSTAIPAMAIALNTTAVKMNVTITSYLLALAVFVPVSGWAADRFGAKRVFIAAIVLFSVSSIACALSHSLIELVLARIVQGLAGAMMVPVGRIILLRKTPKADLLKAMSFIALPALMGPIIGPPLGGFLVTYASWHWIFLINVPVGIIGVAMIMHYIPYDPPMPSLKLDWIGFLLSGICLATLVYGFESLGHRDQPFSYSAVLIGTGLTCGILYVWHAKHAKDPIIDLKLLRVPTFAISVLGGNVCRFSVGATPFLLAIMLQVGFGLSPFATGMITFSTAVGALIMKLIVTRVIHYFGFKRILTFNAIIAGASVALCGAFRADTPWWIMISILIVGGIFRSLQFTAVNTLTYADLGPAEMSRASSFAAMAQQLGLSLGVGFAALILNVSMNVRGVTQLETIDAIWAFVLIGAISASSVFSFMRLPKDVGAHMHQHKKIS